MFLIQQKVKREHLPGYVIALRRRLKARFNDRKSRSDEGVLKWISESYRSLHGICGIGPRVGFAATVEAARAPKAPMTP